MNMTRDEAPLVKPAPLFWRLPIIRHVRAMWHAERIDRWERNWRAIGMVPQAFDRRVVRQIWRGIV